MTVIEWPRWLKLKVAAEYSAIGQKRLIELAEMGHVRGFKDPDSGRSDWIFDRFSLDTYRESQAMQTGNLSNKALEILRSLGQS
jgi:hypothetical protein